MQNAYATVYDRLRLWRVTLDDVASHLVVN